MPTTGLNTAAQIRITSSAPTLVLVGSSQLLTYQLTAQVVDAHGNVLGIQPQLYYASDDIGLASVSSSGLVTAHQPGLANITVACAALGNSISMYTAQGLPWNSVQATQPVQVVPGVAIVPDFSFTLSTSSIAISSTGTASLTITQTAQHGFTGTVTYHVSGPFANGGLSKNGTILWAPTALQITGSATGAITFTATAAPVGSVPFYVWGQANPQAANSGDVFGDSVRALTHTTAATLVVS